MKNKIKYLYIIPCLFFMLNFFACENMEDTYSEFYKDGETVYIAKADSIKATPGYNRIQLSWLLLSDPKVDSYKIYWNNKRDSLEGSVTKTAEVDTVRVMLNEMSEGLHHFEIFMYDEFKNSSIKSSTIGTVYGKNYVNSLLQRPLKSAQRQINDDVVFTWVEPSESTVHVEVEYVDNDDNAITHIVANAAELDTISNISLSSTVKYRTGFLPEPLSLDTFYTEYAPIIIGNEVEFNKSLWKDADLADDANVGRVGNAYADITSLWNGPIGNKFFFQDPNYAYTTSPNWFTIDVGRKYKFTRMNVMHVQHSESWMYTRGTPRFFEIWATNNPTTEWDDWTLLGEFETVKPSGLDKGVTASDIAQIKAGHEHEFIEVDEAFRYFRFKTIEAWDGRKDIMLLGLTLYGEPSK